MIETNTQTGEQNVFCDRCSKRLTDKVVIMASGDCLCEECFSNEHRIITVEEYLNEVT